MKRLLVVLALAAAPARAAEDGPGDAALSFLRGLAEEKGKRKMDDTALAPDTPDQRRDQIAERLRRLGRGIRPDDLRVIEQRTDGELAAVLVSQITDYDANSVQVHAVGLVRGGDRWRPAPLPSSFDATGLSFRPGFLPRAKKLEEWMLRARSEQLVRLRDDAFALLFDEMRKLRSPDELHEAAPEKLAVDFLAAARDRTLPAMFALLGGLENPRPSEWEEVFQTVSRVFSRPVIRQPNWRLLAAPESLRVPVLTERDGEDALVSIVALDPAGDFGRRPQPRAVHLPFVRSDDGLWRIHLPQELSEMEPPEHDEDDEVDAGIVARFPEALREALPPLHEPTPRAAATALLDALRAPTLEPLARRLDLTAESSVALDTLGRAARLWQGFHRPGEIAAPLLLDLHESGDDACLLVQLLSAKTPEKPALEALFLKRGPAGWLANPGLTGAAALAHVKDPALFGKWLEQARDARAKDWTEGLLVRLGGIAADSAPGTDEARRVVESWRASIVAGDAAGMLALSACFDDPEGTSRLLRNSGYELQTRQQGEILEVHRVGRWSAVSMRVPPAEGDDSAAAYPLYVVAATAAGPRVLPELDLFDPLTRGREFLNRRVWDRVAARLPDGARGELESIYEKHRTLSAADRQPPADPAE
jgi:hypothetical protein